MSNSVKWLYVKDVAALAGIKPHDLRTRVSRGYVPKYDDDGARQALPDGRIIDVPANRRMPRWREDGKIKVWLHEHAIRVQRSDQQG